MYIVKTYSSGKEPKNYHFYVLNKGENAGKPSLTPFANSFVVTSDDLKVAQMAYHACKALFITGRFKIYLRGSVVPFIVMKDFCTELKMAFDKGISRDLETLKALKLCNEYNKQLRLSQDLSSKLQELEQAMLYDAFVREPEGVYLCEVNNTETAIMNTHVPFIAYLDRNYYVQGDAAKDIIEEIIRYSEDHEVSLESAISRYAEHYL
jgi:hypothetical protein